MFYTFTLPLLLFFSFVQSDPKLDELDKKNGFKSLQFGKSTSEIFDFQLELKKKEEGIDIYSISNPNIKISEVPVKSINCYFIMDKLVLVNLSLDVWGRTNISVTNVEDLLVNTFGTPKNSNPDLNIGSIKTIFINEKIWVGKKVKLTYSSMSGSGGPNTYSLTYEVIDFQEKKTEAKIQSKKQFSNSHSGDL